ncbi:MAG: MFS transporter [Chloroflexota bacterium]|nr:MFS transporter [Chloroflexota bacterium]
MTNTTDFDQQVEANFRWNFAVNILDIMFFKFGVNFVSQATIMPLLVSQLTPSKVVIGLIPAIHSLGYLLPQLLTANFTEQLPRKKPFVMLLGGLGERGPYLLIGLVVSWLAGPAPRVALVVVLLLLTLSAASSGTATPAWFDMIAKVIPVHKRGLWSGVGNSLAALLGMAGAALAGRILTDWPFPRNFGLCFILAFVALVISWVGLALNREPENPTVKPHTSLGHYLRQLPNVLGRDRNYVRFLISRSVVNLGGMAVGFFAVYGNERFTLRGTQVGALTAILVGSQALMNPLWGIVGDRRGHKAVLCGVAFSTALATTAMWLASSPAWLWIAFGLLGVSMAGNSVSGMNIILEFCAPEDRPTYIGLTNTLLAPVKALAPVLGGWLATWTSYREMFTVALLIASLGGVLLTLWVREPRQIRQVEPAVAA